MITRNIDPGLLSYMEQLKIFDTHEHLPAWENRRNASDFFCEYLYHYLSCDLVSSGLPSETLELVRGGDKLDVNEKWKLVEPYWENCRQTGYCRSLDNAVKLIYGIDRIDRETVEPLNRAFMSAKAGGNHYKHVLRDICHIEKSLLDEDLGCDRTYFDSLYRIDKFIMPMSRYSVENLGRERGADIHSLKDWCAATEKLLADAIDGGAVGFKCALAYNRTLKFDKTSREAAERAFDKMLTTSDEHEFQSIGKPFQDYMMHFVLDLLQSRNKTLQIHTGLQEGNGNMLNNSSAEHMNNLFLEFPMMKFDILHISYPYQRILGALCKNFPNVYIDMAWVHIISQNIGETALDEYMDLVPINKLSCFGGDYCFIDGVAGHWQAAIRSVARVLTHRAEEGIITNSQAEKIAQAVLYDNPRRIYYNI